MNRRKWFLSFAIFVLLMLSGSVYAFAAEDDEVESCDVIRIIEDDIAFSENTDNLRGYRVDFSWTISAYGQKNSASFSKTAGTYIYINVTQAPSSSYRFGIIKPDGTEEYLLANGPAANLFVLSATGSYKVYIYNYSNDSIHVEGYYNN